MKSVLIFIAFTFVVVCLIVGVIWVKSTRTVLNRAQSSSQPESTRLPSGVLAQELQKAAKNLQARFVTSAGVDYSALSVSPEFADYLKLVAQLPFLDLTSLTNRQEKLAFWINLYNSLVIHAVTDFQVEKKVWDTPTFFEKAAYQVGHYRFSLNDIENGILRANRKGPLSLGRPFGSSDPRISFALTEAEFDPRIHFALNCASRSCPAIHFYEAARIDAQLEAAAKTFIESETRVEGDVLKTSAIFNWYRGDFGDDLQEFLARFLSPEQRRQVAGKKMRIEFQEYNWGLNRNPHFDSRTKSVAQ